MDFEFWRQRWQQGRTPFHQTAPNPRLVTHVDALGAPGRVLVPLCGKSVDLVYLSELGFAVTGVELVPEAVEAFWQERGVVPERGDVGGLPLTRSNGLSLVNGDIFALTPALAGTFDAIWDRAALVALPSETRAAYARHLAALAAPGARLLLVSFHHDLPDGPPFSVPDAEVRALFDPAFALERRELVDILPEEPRFKERGASRMDEIVWVGRRRA